MTVNISKIYFLVHPFYDARKGGENEKVVLKPEQAKEMIQLYKGEIKKRSMEKDALLFIQFSGYGKARHKVDFELQELAKNSFGKRFFVLESPTGRETRDSGGKKFSTVSNALEKNGFLFDPKKIKTIGFGEYLDRSVFQQLFILNMALGMKKPAPYKNSQSRILLKKSVSFYGGYPTPGEIREAKKMPKSKLDKFVRERIANHLAKTRENTKFWTKQFKPVRRKKK